MLSLKFIKKVLDKIEKLDIKNLKMFIYSLVDDREFFKSIFESMIEGIVVLNECSQIQYINLPARNILQIRQLDIFEIIEKNIFQILVKDHAFQSIQKLILSNKKVYSKELISFSNVKRVIQYSLIPLFKDSFHIGTVILLLDITLQKERQVKLHRAESLAALTNLAAGVAHEIKNPLGALDIHVQLLERYTKKLQNPLKKEFQKLINVILDEIDRLNIIVKDFLFSVSPIHLKPKVFDLVELIESIVKLMKPEFNQKKISIKLNIRYNSIKVNLDRKFLYQAFMNIIKNALEAINVNKKYITNINKKEKLNIYLNQKDQEVILIFKDTGRGMDENKLTKVFEPYYTTKSFGTGLGLTIVYDIIKKHEGSIKLDSKKGKGTTFTIILPVNLYKKQLLEY